MLRAHPVIIPINDRFAMRRLSNAARRLTAPLACLRTEVARWVPDALVDPQRRIGAALQAALRIY